MIDQINTLSSSVMMLAILPMFISTAVEAPGGLKCYQCGTYSSNNDGSVLPCYTYDESNLKPCKPEDMHCVKYVNKGIVVRQCVSECKTGIQGLSELYCCQENGCNGANFARPHLVILVSVMAVSIVYSVVHSKDFFISF